MADRDFKAEQVLAGLKDFQARTVHYAFQRLFGDQGATRRFLVADEVGLGKTMVARGIIARAVEHLMHKKDRIDILYICSNAAIASQNIAKLNCVPGGKAPRSTRLTLLPKQTANLEQAGVNFLSLTPGTAFDHTRSSGGRKDERAVLFALLEPLTLPGAEPRLDRDGLLNLLQGAAQDRDRWRELAEWQAATDDESAIDPKIADLYQAAVRADTNLLGKFDTACHRFSEYQPSYSAELRELRNELLATLRKMLAAICVSALKPDLVVLDEFQRFKDLMTGDDDAALLAKNLFEQDGARILLLSATPYKMYTQVEEEEDHYTDFKGTLRFLYGGHEEKVERIDRLLSGYRRALQNYQSDRPGFDRAKEAVELELRQVMSRTERSQQPGSANAMVDPITIGRVPTASDIKHAVAMERLSRALKAGSSLDYWKSSPYLLSYLRHYSIRRKLQHAHEKGELKAYRELFGAASAHQVSTDRLREFATIDPGNPRMRQLVDDTLGKDMHKLLWMPPSLPYTQPEGFFRGKEGLTKVLVFSRWSAVPDAIASVLSYKAERRIKGRKRMAYDEWSSKSKKGLYVNSKTTGMATVGWMLPYSGLASLIDPLGFYAGTDALPSVSQLRDECKRRLESALAGKLPKQQERLGRPDTRWYWVAPLLLGQDDRLIDMIRGYEFRAVVGDGHLAEAAAKIVAGYQDLGKLGSVPKDLYTVLADLATGGPGVCALRGLHRVAAAHGWETNSVLKSALSIGNGFRSLFVNPEAVIIVLGVGQGSKGSAGGAKRPFWHKALMYAQAGNLQSMLDEFLHIQAEAASFDNSDDGPLEKIAENIASVLGVKAGSVTVDRLRPPAKRGRVRFQSDPMTIRCRFAVRYGEKMEQNDDALDRAVTVQEAFNSPFKPFVLASTSLGQEGLDFHPYCHAVMHWNLPSNPVDMEQREGRVHRYKGHAVRKNVAKAFGQALNIDPSVEPDPWTALFDRAVSTRPEAALDLDPYWIFERTKEPSKIERRVPFIHFTKEEAAYQALTDRLVQYRLAFGQPRQEDLLATLGHDMASDGTAINLAPPKIEE